MAFPQAPFVIDSTLAGNSPTGAVCTSCCTNPVICGNGPFCQPVDSFSGVRGISCFTLVPSRTIKAAQHRALYSAFFDFHVTFCVSAEFATILTATVQDRISAPVTYFPVHPAGVQSCMSPNWPPTMSSAQSPATDGTLSFSSGFLETAIPFM